MFFHCCANHHGKFRLLSTLKIDELQIRNHGLPLEIFESKDVSIQFDKWIKSIKNLNFLSCSLYFSASSSANRCLSVFHLIERKIRLAQQFKSLFWIYLIVNRQHNKNYLISIPLHIQKRWTIINKSENTIRFKVYPHFPSSKKTRTNNKTTEKENRFSETDKNTHTHTHSHTQNQINVF